MATETKSATNIAADFLEEAKSLLAGGVSKKGHATDEDDNPVDLTSDEARKFSVHGALQRVAHNRRDSTGIDTAIAYLESDQVTDPSLTGLTGLEPEILAKRFDRAIARAKGEVWKDPDTGKRADNAEASAKNVQAPKGGEDSLLPKNT